MSAVGGTPGPSEFRAAARLQGVEEDVERATHVRETHEAIEELEEHGTLKPPWYRRLFRRHRTDQG